MNRKRIHHSQTHLPPLPALHELAAACPLVQTMHEGVPDSLQRAWENASVMRANDGINEREYGSLSLCVFPESGRGGVMILFRFSNGTVSVGK